MRHLVETNEWSDSEIRGTLDLARSLKAGAKPPVDFRGRSMALLFLNPSLRTRVSFVRAVEQLGGSVLAMDAGKDNWKMVMGEGVVMDGDGVEHVKDGIPVLGRYCDFLGLRAFGDMKSYAVDRKDEMIRAVARYSTVPVVNMESAMAHPCQSFADMLTIEESGRKKPKVVLTWAPHPKALPMAVPNSFLLLATRMGWNVALLRPQGFDLDPDVMAMAQRHSLSSGGTLLETDDRNKVFQGADAVYAKSWGSMEAYGNPEREKAKKENLKEWTVDRAAMSKTSDAIFLHCLPVRRNVEVTDDVLDSAHSRVIDEAENRMHVQKAILCQLARWNGKKE
ncbi:MAG: N-acetylornithine carbamoyltransferase [Pseudomonadota bacterium]